MTLKILVLFWGANPHFDIRLIRLINTISWLDPVFLIPLSTNSVAKSEYQNLEGVRLVTRGDGLLPWLVHFVLFRFYIAKELLSTRLLLVQNLFAPPGLLIFILLFGVNVKKAVLFWGGEFYSDNFSSSFVRQFFVSRIDTGGLGVIGDEERFRRAYPFFNGKISEFSFPYDAEALEFIEGFKQDRSTLPRICVGHSAIPSNRHTEVLERLRTIFRGQFKIRLYLTYGVENYRQEVIRAAYRMFGRDFVEIFTQWMSPSAFLKSLSECSLGIYNHSRQQAGNNIMFMVAMGIPICISKENTMSDYLDSKGIFYSPMESMEQLIEDGIKAPPVLNRKLAVDLMGQDHAKKLMESLIMRALAPDRQSK